MTKRMLSLLLALVMVFSILPMSALAVERDDAVDQVHVIVENTTFLEPVDDVAPAWTGTLVDTWVDLNEESTMMSCVVAALDEVGAVQTGAESNYISEINGLEEFDGGAQSGWMGTLNDWFTNEGFGAYTVASGKLGAGDEIRIMYTCSYGADLGGTWGNNDTSLKSLVFSAGTLEPAFDSKTLEYTLTVPIAGAQVVVTPTAANKNFQVHIKIGETEYKRTDSILLQAGTTLTIEVGTGLSMNEGATPTFYKVHVDAPHADIAKMYETTGALLEKMAKETVPSVGSIGGEWVVIGLARSGRPVPEDYYDNVVTYVEQKINDKEQLHRAKSTENSRIILALTALGLDVTDVAGHNLLKGLTDMNYLKRQGNNGPIWALIAFDSHDYEVPAVFEGGVQVTRDGLIDYILGVQLPDGGWALSNDSETKADADMTGMALQALAPYYGKVDKVTAAVNKALETLSAMQLSNGGYDSWGTVNVESCAQVLVALDALGVDVLKDERFVKNGRTIVDAMAAFYLEDGGFVHTVSQTDVDGMATEQSYYALTALARTEAGKTHLYEMTEMTILPFSDVAYNAWFRDDVRYALDEGYMKGNEFGDFKPYGRLTRAELVTILYRMADQPEVTIDNPFKDVKPGRYYAPAVQWAYENGITSGTSAAAFSPNAKITRSELATFMMRFAKYLGADTGARADIAGFADAAKVPGYAKEPMQWAVAVELMTGSTKNELMPDGEANRGVCAAMLHRFDNIVEE